MLRKNKSGPVNKKKLNSEYDMKYHAIKADGYITAEED